MPGHTSTLFNAAINSASVHKFPVLNGLGVSVARADIAPGGVLPMHTHPGGSEIILVAKGSVTAGLISLDNTVYLKTVEEGNIMVFPQGLLHFLVNTGGTQALLWVSISFISNKILFLIHPHQVLYSILLFYWFQPF